MKRLLSAILVVCLLLGLFPAIMTDAQALCGTTGGNMDIILVLDHSNSMYPPASNNATALDSAISEFLKIAFADNNAAGNKIAVVQYDSLARAWNGSAAVEYNYSMTLSDYSSLTYSNCFMNTTAKVNAAVSALMTTPDTNYTMGGMTNTMGGLRMAELVASTRSTSTTRDLLVIMFTDGLPTCRYFTSTKDWYWDNDGTATSAWEYTRALEAGQSLRKCVDKYTKCKSFIYNIALLNSSDITSQHQKIADYFMSNSTNYAWTYDTNVNSDNYTDLTQYVDKQSTYFKTKTTPWADQYTRLSSTNDFITLCKTIANDYTKLGYAEHNLTYTNDGDTHTVKCTQCEYTLTESHTLGAWTVTEAATCTAAGVESATCSVCKNSVTRTIAQLAHTTVNDPAVEPSCGTPGLTAGSHCSSCGTVFVAQQEIPAIAHSYTALTTLATCTEDGYTTYLCENCDDSYTDDFIPALGHDYVTSVTEATCTSGGYTTYTCLACNDSYTGNTTPAAGHDYVATVTAPSCTEQGYTTYKCSGCNDSYVSDYVSPTDHDYIATVTDPTCTSVGFTTYKCGNCNESYTDDYVPALSHDYVGNTIAPTCTEQGFTIYTCELCGDFYKENYVAALGHNYGSGTVTTQPTCLTDGVRTYTCTCGESYTETIKASGHTLEYRPAKAAACGSDGNKAYYFCTSCSSAFIDEACEYELPLSYFIIKAPEHTYSYKNNGSSHTATCGNCSASVTEAHSFIDGACICGAIKSTEPEYIPDPSLTFTMNITAGVEMAVNYSIMASTVSSYTDFYLLISKQVAGGEPITAIYGITDDRLPMTDVKHPGTGAAIMYNATFSGINAKEMGDKFTTTLFAVDQYGAVHYSENSTTSIKDYLIGKINDTASLPEMKTMAVDMLKYGAAAQVHLNYDTNNLVTKTLTAAQLAYGTQTLPEAKNYQTTMGSGKSINTSITVNERVRLALTCIHTPSGSGEMTYLIMDTASAKMIDELPAEVMSNVMCRATFAEVGAKDMRRRITIALYDNSNIVSQFLVWSVESYVAQIREKAGVSQSELNMANALLTYGDSVAAYMAVTN